MQVSKVSVLTLRSLKRRLSRNAKTASAQECSGSPSDTDSAGVPDVGASDSTKLARRAARGRER